LKRFLCVALIAAATLPAVAADVGVSISVGQPGFYGQIDLGNFPQLPQVIYPQPVLIQRVPVGAAPPPLYLRVPPGQAKNWRKHCRKYNACDRQVYFVQEQWYNDVYAPHYREHGPHQNGRRGNSNGNGYDRDNGHDNGKHQGRGRDQGEPDRGR
jgi:hypothetical protein